MSSRPCKPNPIHCQGPSHHQRAASISHIDEVPTCVSCSSRATKERAQRRPRVGACGTRVTCLVWREHPSFRLGRSERRRFHSRPQGPVASRGDAGPCGSEWGASSYSDRPTKDDRQASAVNWASSPFGLTGCGLRKVAVSNRSPQARIRRHSMKRVAERIRAMGGPPCPG